MILKFLDSLHWTSSFFLVALVFMLFTTISILLVRKTVSLSRLKDSHDITGIIFSNLGALYAVLLGFTIVNAQSRFDKVKESTQIEVACLIDLYRDADLFSEKDHTNIKSAITSYVNSIVTNEWSQKQAHLDTGTKFKELLRCYYEAEVTTLKQTVWYTASVEKLNDLSDLRLSRILASHESIGPEMWTILILGGCGMILFLCFFGPEKPTQHLLMATILAITIAFSLFLIHSLDTVFTGKISIQSDAFRNLLQIISQDLNC